LVKARTFDELGALLAETAADLRLLEISIIPGTPFDRLRASRRSPRQRPSGRRREP
jgi:hypothetical protein